MLDDPNLSELRAFLQRCHEAWGAAGGRSQAFRRKRAAFSLTHNRTAPRHSANALGILRELPIVREFKGNPVMDLHGMQVTYWNFSDATCKSINLFADGTLGQQYLLPDTTQLRRRSVA